MKNKKLSLDALKVQSFVTSMDDASRQTVKGGDMDHPSNEPCDGGGGTGFTICRCPGDDTDAYGCNTYDWGCKSHYPCYVDPAK